MLSKRNPHFCFYIFLKRPNAPLSIFAYFCKPMRQNAYYFYILLKNKQLYTDATNHFYHFFMLPLPSNVRTK